MNEGVKGLKMKGQSFPPRFGFGLKMTVVKNEKTGTIKIENFEKKLEKKSQKKKCKMYV